MAAAMIQEDVPLSTDTVFIRDRRYSPNESKTQISDFYPEEDIRHWENMNDLYSEITQARFLNIRGTMDFRVPGSGKTHTLSALAAKLVEQMMMNKAFEFRLTEPSGKFWLSFFKFCCFQIFSARIAKFLSKKDWFPESLSCRTCTHGYRIVRGRARLRLGSDFNILVKPQQTCFYDGRLNNGHWWQYGYF